LPVQVDVRFYGELNDLVALGRRDHRTRVAVHPGTTVKDLAESLGVPHTEIDVIALNGSTVGFDERLGEGDRLDVYPASASLDVQPVIHLRPDPSIPLRFVLDVHLGRLARYLRLLGFDAVWPAEPTDQELVRVSGREDRILLTRDRGILKRAAVAHGYLVRETVPRRQIDEVLSRFGVTGPFITFGRCLVCNGRLEDVDKSDVLHLLPPRTRRDYDEFRHCSACGRVYWKGSHYDRLQAQVDDIRRSASGPSSRPQEPSKQPDPPPPKRTT
jgi:uncharacterized protein with PIN domain/sulfur carrier protein ThiS